jgi:hypothetical protein
MFVFRKEEVQGDINSFNLIKNMLVFKVIKNLIKKSLTNLLKPDKFFKFFRFNGFLRVMQP